MAQSVSDQRSSINLSYGCSSWELVVVVVLVGGWILVQAVYQRTRVKIRLKCKRRRR